jgi:hypothetical protein
MIVLRNEKMTHLRAYKGEMRWVDDRGNVSYEKPSDEPKKSSIFSRAKDYLCQLNDLSQMKARPTTWQNIGMSIGIAECVYMMHDKIECAGNVSSDTSAVLYSLAAIGGAFTGRIMINYLLESKTWTGALSRLFNETKTGVRSVANEIGQKFIDLYNNPVTTRDLREPGYSPLEIEANKSLHKSMRL